MERLELDQTVKALLEAPKSSVTLEALTEEIVHQMGGVKALAQEVLAQYNSAADGGQTRNYILRTIFDGLAKSEAMNRDRMSAESRMSDDELRETISQLMQELNASAPATTEEEAD